MSFIHLSIHTVAVLLLFISCSQSENGTRKQTNTKSNVNDMFGSDWNKLPEASNISEFPKTDFVLTLENEVDDNTNIIYAPAFLFAWDQIKTKFNSPIIISQYNSKDFGLINTSTTFQNSLKNDEYSSSVELVDDAIIAKAFFNKTLPFSISMKRTEVPITFNKIKVESFGMEYHNEDIAELTQILYYKDDDNFILKLKPADNNHEIILVKGLKNYSTFSDALVKSNALIKTGNKERINPRQSWKYSFADTDNFIIPILKFNIEKNYSSLEGQRFYKKNNSQLHIIQTAYQRTALF